MECVEVGLQRHRLVLRKKVSTFNGGECLNILSIKEQKTHFAYLTGSPLRTEKNNPTVFSANMQAPWQTEAMHLSTARYCHQQRVKEHRQ